MKQSLMTGAIVFVAVMLALVAAPFVMPLIHGEPIAATGEAGGSAERARRGPALYTALDPPLLANFVDDTGSTRFLQLGVQAMTHEQKVIDAIQVHAPALRNAFLLLITNQSYAEVVTREGKERLREEMLLEARATLQRQAGLDGIEELYFTSFIIQ